MEPIQFTPYMTVVEGRRPRQKVHKTLGHAKNAFDTERANPLTGEKYNYMTHSWGTLYEYADGEWRVLYEIPQPTKADGKLGEWRTVYETRPWRIEEND